MAIEQLSDELINQIAAGEVIENPSGVVKELVENSLDAKATHIEIELEEAGLKKIIIKDNGSGIEKDDLLKAPLRHATSKIKSFNDLYSINSMGFRGEALASIFSVAKTTLKSKHEESEEAFEVTSENLEIKASASSKGTTIIVEDLFYNTPARKKYLKSQNLELKSILDVVKQFEIVHFDKKISLKHNGKILVNKPIFQTVEENLYFVLGKELKRNLFPVEMSQEGLKVKGFIANPSNVTYNSSKNQYIFVNQRGVKSKIVKDAVYDGFTTNLMKGKHPFFVLELEIDPELVDVNVHPKKLEIRFEDERSVFVAIKNAIMNVFSTQELSKPFELPEEDSSLESHVDVEIGKKIPRVKEEKTYYTKDTQSSLDEDFSIDSEDKNEPLAMNIEDTWAPEVKGPLYEVLREYKILGQINKTYIVLETPKEMILVDQHIAEEKYFFEKFKKMAEQNKAKSQSLLKPMIISLTNQEFLLYKEYESILHSFGFETEEFGSNEIMIRKVPLDMRQEIISPELVKEILDFVGVDGKSSLLEEKRTAILASMACKISITAGHELTTPQIRRMIENLRRLEEPFNCPHGRPTLLKYPYYELDKKFKRIV